MLFVQTFANSAVFVNNFFVHVHCDIFVQGFLLLFNMSMVLFLVQYSCHPLNMCVAYLDSSLLCLMSCRYSKS
jgi:hypothetical protein